MFQPQIVDQQRLVKLYRQALSSGVPLSELEQKVARKTQRLHVADQVETQQAQQQVSSFKKSVPWPIRLGSVLVPLALISVGFLLLGSAVMPIVTHYFKNFQEIQAAKLAAPIPQEKILDVTPLVIAQTFDNEVATVQDKFEHYTGPVIVNAKLDYTNLSNWFEEENEVVDLQNQTSLLSQHTGEYILEIPKLKIENAKVKIGGTDLDKSLIQYPGTSLPGKPGSPVVFGHSVLRQFYNPKESNPRRYNSIFSTIMTLKKGDKFYVKYGEATYTYVVIGHSEVKPTDTYILQQDYSKKQFKLVTCVPEGTYLRRGVVTAQLVKD